MKRILLTGTLVAIIATASLSQSNQAANLQTDRESLLKTRLEPAIQKTMLENQVPGFAVGVVKDGKLVYARGFGVAKLGAEQPITSTSLFHMASVTKTFVATAVMQLVEQGRINLDAPLTTYLPYFRLNDERYKQITIRQMLSHISGIPDVTNYNWDKPEFDDKALERFVRSISNLSMVSAPGKRFGYSNAAYEVLGDVIAKVSGESFEDYVQHHILTPLGMKHSTLLLRDADTNFLTAPHIKEKGKAVVSQIFPYNRAHAPSSTLYSSIEDLSRYAIANLNRGELEGKRILKAATYDALWKPVAAAGNSQIGISWFLLNLQGHRVVFHSGGDVGFNSFLVLAPDDAVAVIAMSNYAADRCYVCDLSLAALRLMLGIESQPQTKGTMPALDTTILNQITTAQVLEKYVEASGGKAALQKVMSRMSKGTFAFSGVALAGKAMIYEKAPNKHTLILDVEGQKSYSTGFDGAVGWENDPDEGLKELAGAELAKARSDADFYQILKLRELYPKIELKGKTTLKGKEVYLLEAPRNGNPKLWYFDTRTGLLTRTEERNATGEVMSRKDYEDYRPVDGLKIPFKLTYDEGGELIVRLTEVKHNVEIDDHKFSKPMNYTRSKLRGIKRQPLGSLVNVTHKRNRVLLRSKLRGIGPNRE